jgi:hypothetical protein
VREILSDGNYLFARNTPHHRLPTPCLTPARHPTLTATVTAIRLPPRHQRFKTSLLRLQRLTAVALGVSARHVLSCRHGFLGNLTDSLYSTRAKPREACRRYHRSSRHFTSHDVPLTECSRPLPMWRRSRKQAAHYPPTPKARTQARAG